jgi:hypothetical protein
VKIQNVGLVLCSFIYGICGLTGCNAASVPLRLATVPLTVQCHTAYRSRVISRIEQEDMVTLTSENDRVTLTYKDLTLTLFYSSSTDYEGRFLKVSVTPAESSDELAAALYQLSKTERPVNQFIGDHGFTGLQFIYHPVTRAELQYRCLARE